MGSIGSLCMRRNGANPTTTTPEHMSTHCHRLRQRQQQTPLLMLQLLLQQQKLHLLHSLPQAVAPLQEC
jgi:hypothetical protein